MVQECSPRAAELLLGRFLALGCYYIRFIYSSDGVEGAYQMDGSDVREIGSDQERIRHVVRIEYHRRVRVGIM
jgi:hypothetical protein